MYAVCGVVLNIACPSDVVTGVVLTFNMSTFHKRYVHAACVTSLIIWADVGYVCCVRCHCDLGEGLC